MDYTIIMGPTIYTASSTLTSNRRIFSGGYTLRIDPRTGIGDAAQSNVMLTVYDNISGDTAAMTVGAGANVLKALAVTGEAVNGTAIQATCQFAGGTGLGALGEAVGGNMAVTSNNGTAMVAKGCGMIKDFDDASGRYDSSLLHLKSATHATLFEPITKAQRDAIPATAGMLVYMIEFDEANPEGPYWYHSVNGWVLGLLDI